MSILARRLRAVFSTAILWGTVWAFACAGFLTVASLVTGSSPFGAAMFEFILIGASLWGVSGAINGAGFALFLSFAERDRTLEQLSRGRMALWGALGGALFPAVTYLLTLALPRFGVLGVSFDYHGLRGIVSAVLLSGTLGAVVASTHLSLARRLPAGTSRRQISGESAT
jgi:hypothetical protein